MDKYIGCMVAAVIILVFGIDASAQTPDRIVADIPFAFFVRSERMPAGRYEFELAARQSHPSPLIIRPVGSTSAESVIAPTLAAEGHRRGKGVFVLFRQYGDSYFLSSVNYNNGSLALTLPRSTTEKRVWEKSGKSTDVAVRPLTQ